MSLHKRHSVNIIPTLSDTTNWVFIMPAVIDQRAGFFCAEGQCCSKKTQNRTLMKPSTKEGLKYQKNSADWIVMIVYAGISGHEISASTEVSTLLRRTLYLFNFVNISISSSVAISISIAS